uniref:Uncharacterized protein n=1 Tax=Trichuris muris TaxID=70415 RepID=A0A5S6QBK8_TRIMR
MQTFLATCACSFDAAPSSVHGEFVVAAGRRYTAQNPPGIILLAFRIFLQSNEVSALNKLTDQPGRHFA